MVPCRAWMLLLRPHLRRILSAWAADVDLAFAFRGGIAYAITLALVVLMRFVALDAHVMVTATALVGAMTWSLHGSTSQLAQLAGGRAVVGQQIGFQLPALLALAAVYGFGVGPGVDAARLDAYFGALVVLVFAGAANFAALLRSQFMSVLFHAKDRQSVEGTPFVEPALPAVREAAVGRLVAPFRWALTFTIFASIFTGAFFPYVPAAQLGGGALAEVLYFVRLGCDLVARPVASLDHPFRTKEWLRLLVLIRVVFVLVFASYILYDGLPRLDGFIIVLVAAMAFGSGFLTVMSYSLASTSVSSPLERTSAGLLMNISFQIGVFIGVLSSEVVAAILAHTGRQAAGC